MAATPIVAEDQPNVVIPTLAQVYRATGSQCKAWLEALSAERSSVPGSMKRATLQYRRLLVRYMVGTGQLSPGDKIWSSTYVAQHYGELCYRRILDYVSVEGVDAYLRSNRELLARVALCHLYIDVKITEDSMSGELRYLVDTSECSTVEQIIRLYTYTHFTIEKKYIAAVAMAQAIAYNYGKRTELPLLHLRGRLAHTYPDKRPNQRAELVKWLLQWPAMVDELQSIKTLISPLVGLITGYLDVPYLEALAETRSGDRVGGIHLFPLCGLIEGTHTIPH